MEHCHLLMCRQQKQNRVVLTLATALNRVPKDCGILYRGYIDSMLSLTLILPSKRHEAVGKESGKTSYIERFNCTMRQRISCLVRKTLSFSKKLENHIGAIWLFIHHYNAFLHA
jgi:insertion element IS1 protein InsB